MATKSSSSELVATRLKISAFTKVSFRKDQGLFARRQWKEAIDRVILLPDDDPKAFFVYQCWLYGGVVDMSRVPHGFQYKTLVQSYILGDKLLDDNFKDCVISSIMERLRRSRVFNIKLTSLVFDNNPAGAPIWHL